MPALSQALSRFFAWWGGELAALLPAGFRLWWQESDRVVMLFLDGKRAAFHRQAGSRHEEIYTIEPGVADAPLHRAETNRRLLQAAGGNFRLLLCLPPDQVLTRTLTLPLAVEENLRQTLTFELDRYTPFKPEQVYFDFRIIERNVERKRLSVKLAAVPKSIVDQGVARATALGVTVNGAVLVDELLQQGGDCCNFLPAATKRHKSAHRLWWRVGMGSLSVVLLLVLLAIPVWQKRAAAISLIDPLARARTASMETDALRDHLRKLVDENNFLHNKKWESYSTVQVLEELSKLLPDDTFAMQLDFDGKTVQMQGETASSTKLVEILEASPLFKDVSFKSQLIKMQGTPYDRFNISATLEEGGRPKPPSAIAVTTSTPAPAPAPVTTPAAAVPTTAAPAAADATLPPKQNTTATAPAAPPSQPAPASVKPAAQP